MVSATHALLWEIYRRHRTLIATIAVLTVAGRLLTLPAIVELLAMLSFLMLFAIFNYTDASDSRSLGQFPRRLFVLPVSSLHLAAVPMITGVAAIEALYLLWRRPLSYGGATSPLLAAVLLGASMVFYLTVLWTLTFLGPVRLAVAGVVAGAMFAVGMVAPWGERTAAMIVGIAAIAAFLLSWRWIASARRGGAHGPARVGRLLEARLPLFRREAFASPLAAQFWFEWRCSGVVLPILVCGVILLFIAPLSVIFRHDASTTFRLLLGTLAAPVILAVPVGMAFGKPAFWSDDLSVPAFLAVRPMSDEDVIAIKVKVALMSSAVSWLVLILFAGTWLTLWGNLDALSWFAIQLWAVQSHSVARVFAMGALIVIAGWIFTWRFLVSGMWSAVSGRRALFIGSALSVVILCAAALAFDADRLPGWLLGDPARMAVAVWVLGAAVVLKYFAAAYFWRGISLANERRYLVVWGAATGALLALGFLCWQVARLYVPVDIYRLQALIIFVSLLAVPLGRVALAPSFLSGNRSNRKRRAANGSPSRLLAALAAVFAVAILMLSMRRQSFVHVPMRMLVEGNGPATVVFVNGGGASLEMWGRVQPRVSEFARTVAYDRAPNRDGVRAAAELHAALRTAGVQPPYVLVGASFGGAHARVFAGMYPRDVAGLVLVDPTPDDAAVSSAARAVIEAARASPIPGTSVVLIDAISSLHVPFATKSVRASRLGYRRRMEAESNGYAAWLDTIPGSRLVVARETGHNVAVEKPELVVDAVRDVLSARQARTAR
jgi:pimeloyl-ACP methyl ester carboxylesterase